jgi:hypothetical protein
VKRNDIASLAVARKVLDVTTLFDSSFPAQLRRPE